MLMARGVGRDSQIIYERPGLQIETVVTKGALPFKVNRLWSIVLSNNETLLVFDLLEISMTAVFTIKLETGALTQVVEN